MRRTNNKYKKWLLYTKNHWPSQALESDPLVREWWSDRHLSAFDWEEQSSIAVAEVQRWRQSAAMYLDYLHCSELFATLEEGYAWCLLNPLGQIIDLHASPETAQRLRSLDIAPGFSFAKQEIGTTAFSLAQSRGHGVSLTCFETYKRALHPFCTLCAPVTNDPRGFFVMGLLDERHEEQLGSCLAQLNRVIARHSNNLQRLTLFDEIVDGLDSMILVQNDLGEVVYRNGEAAKHTSGQGIVVAGRMAFAFNELAGESEQNELKRYLPEAIASLSIKRKPIAQGTLYSLSLHLEPLESDEWKREVIGEVIAKDSYLDKIIALRPKNGLRLFLSAEVGSGESYIVRYLHRQLKGKTLHHLDCMAGFQSAILSDASKENFKQQVIRANGQILHLENIDYLSLELQSWLLKSLSMATVVDEFGQVNPLSVDLICSAARGSDWQASRTSRMLYHMLSSHHLDLKPLNVDRERLEQTIHAALTTISFREGNPLTIEPAAMAVLLNYRWPGNFLELFQVLENALFSTSCGVIRAEQLPERLHKQTPTSFGLDQIRDAERHVIMSLWKEHRGRVTHVAKALGMSRTTLWRKMKKLQLDGQTMIAEE